MTFEPPKLLNRTVLKPDPVFANLLGFAMPVWLEPTVTRVGIAVLSIRHLILPLIAWGLSRALGVLR